MKFMRDFSVVLAQWTSHCGFVVDDGVFNFSTFCSSIQFLLLTTQVVFIHVVWRKAVVLHGLRWSWSCFHWSSYHELLIVDHRLFVVAISVINFFYCLSLHHRSICHRSPFDPNLIDFSYRHVSSNSVVTKMQCVLTTTWHTRMTTIIILPRFLQCVWQSVATE